MIPFFIVMLAALVLIIGLWNGAFSFGEAYWQAYGWRLATYLPAC